MFFTGISTIVGHMSRKLRISRRQNYPSDRLCSSLCVVCFPLESAGLKVISGVYNKASLLVLLLPGYSSSSCTKTNTHTHTHTLAHAHCTPTSLFSQAELHSMSPFFFSRACPAARCTILFARYSERFYIQTSVLFYLGDHGPDGSNQPQVRQ